MSCVKETCMLKYDLGNYSWKTLVIKLEFMDSNYHMCSFTKNIIISQLQPIRHVNHLPETRYIGHFL